MLAVGALVASILAVGTTPAAATSRKPDFEAQWKACLGPALADHDFSDVSESGNASHYANINCLAYYGITKGRTADTFAPGANVTRSQMALFLARAADVADIDLGEAVDQGFTDLNADDTERVDAINRVVGGRCQPMVMPARSPAIWRNHGPGEDRALWEGSSGRNM